MKQAIVDGMRERRLLLRYALRLPVVLVSGTSPSTVVGMTRNISAKGVSFFVSHEIEVEPNIQFVLEFPPEITKEDTLRMRCTGRVVRIDRNGPSTGIAALINDYEFLQEPVALRGTQAI